MEDKENKKSGKLKAFGRVMKKVGIAVGGAVTGGALPDVLGAIGEAALPAVVVAASEGTMEDPVEAWAVRLGGAVAGFLLAWLRMKKNERRAAAGL